MTPAAAGWDDYLARFHDDEAGITEDLLGRTSDDGTDPYTWCAEPLRSRSGTVLDLAGGSGPMADHLGPAWVGVDTARGELAVARAAGRTALAQGSATQLPVPDAAVSTVVCTMSLQVIAPLTDALVEADRVLDEQGRLVLLLPASRPLGWRDGWTYLRLQVALRAVIRYPNAAALSPRRLARRAPGHGLAVTSDERRTFALPLPDAEAAALLVRSLYLPGTPAERRERARPIVEARMGDSIGIPLRRVVLDRP
ncbi:MAG: class I SAM-dependent methyltransferase [Iamia sp.]